MLAKSLRLLAAAGTAALVLFQAVAPVHAQSRTQTLTGFSYTPATVTFPAGAPANPPTGAETGPLSYTTSHTEVCTVDSATGTVTPVDVGICRVTATAPRTEDYEKATAEAEVVILESPAGLVGTGELEIEVGSSIGSSIVRTIASGGYLNIRDVGDPRQDNLRLKTTFGQGGAMVHLYWLTGHSEAYSDRSLNSANGLYTRVFSERGLPLAPEGDVLTLYAVATKVGYAAVTVSMTVTVDLHAPMAAYDFEPLTAGVSIAESPTRESADVSMRAIGPGLPQGLSFNPAIGQIHGTPRDSAAATVTVTLTDNAGNMGESEIVFRSSADVRKAQPLTRAGPENFRYPPTLTSRDTTAPLIDRPILSTGPLTFATTDTGVCSVDSRTGEVSALSAGTCRVTVTAPRTSEWEQATVETSLEIEFPPIVPGILRYYAEYELLLLQGRATPLNRVVVDSGVHRLAARLEERDARFPLFRPLDIPKPLSYTTSDPDVCSVDENTGLLTPLSPGLCRVTVTSPRTQDYESMSYTASVDVYSVYEMIDEATGPDFSRIILANNGGQLVYRVLVGGNGTNGYYNAVDGGGLHVSGTAARPTETRDYKAELFLNSELIHTEIVSNYVGRWQLRNHHDATIAELYRIASGHAAGVPLTVEVVLTEENRFLPATVTATLSVDVEYPTATYTIPSSLTVGVSVDIIPTMKSPDIARYDYRAVDPPPGLTYDPTTGSFHGAPTEPSDFPTREGAMGLHDHAGNVQFNVRFSFPPVSRNAQPLIGFSYTPATVTLSSTVATATPPTGAKEGSPLSYATTDTGVCTVDSTTGAVTPRANVEGVCRVTVTAPGTEDGYYLESTAVAAVEINTVDPGTVLTMTGDWHTDGHINRLEHESGLTVGGTFGMQAGGTVNLTFSSVRGVRTVETTTGADGTWSVEVTAGTPTHAYIGGIPHQGLMALQAVGSYGGYPPSTVTVTVTVDLVDPAVTYNLPPLTAAVDIGRIRPSSRTNSIVTYLISGLPAGLSYDPADGAISGAPIAFSAVAATAAVMLTEQSGNTGETEIVFPAPAVARNPQALSGFSYTAATVTFPFGATARPPPGIRTPLSYATTDTGVCTVDSTGGAVTSVAPGTCRVTVTAPRTDVYEAATVTATVEIEPAGGLFGSGEIIVTSLSDSDDYINRLEYASGLTVGGMFGQDAATVSLTFDGGRALETTTEADGSWAIAVSGAAYTHIGGLSEGGPLMLQAVASKSGFSAATVLATVTVDLEDPSAQYRLPEMTVDMNIGTERGRAAESNDIAVRTIGSGVPPGLTFNSANGHITGAPTESVPAAAVDLTLTDVAGNMGTVQIMFPEAAKLTQTLSEFTYTPSPARFAAVATTSGPTGAQTPLAYSTPNARICGVDSATGTLTPKRLGTCRVRAIAPESSRYERAVVIATVTIRASGELATGATLTVVGNTDDYIDEDEYTGGLTVGGVFGTDAATVNLTFDGGRTVETTTGSDGSWSVEVASGDAYTYIGGLSEGAPLTLQAVANKRWYTPATVSVTLTVDLEDPAVRYPAPAAIPALTAGVSVTVSPTSESGVSMRTISGDLPAGLEFDPADGRIHGAPSGYVATGATVTVTVADAAGNVDTAAVEFSAVSRQTQDLSGFAYAAATVTIPAVATAAPPPGAQTPLTYSTTDTGVCNVDSTTGTVTPVDAGTCRVTVTAAQTDVYALATAEAEVEIEQGDLTGSGVLVVESRSNTDGYINRLEYAEGLTVSGMFGLGAATVNLTFDGGRALETTTESDGAWTLAVASGDAYTHIGTISAGGLLTLQAVATKSSLAAATVSVTLTVDLEDPAVGYPAPAAIPTLTAGVGVTVSPTSESGVSMRTISGDLPAGLEFDPADGRIHGAPSGYVATGATVTVTVADAAGNVDTAAVEFSAVSRQTQDLSDFAYSPSEVTFPTAATATPPAGPHSDPLAYTTSDTGVCTVNLTTGEVTPVAVGTCGVTVTAPRTAVYELATAEASVTILVLDTLVAGAEEITVTSLGNTDGYINRLEYAADLTVSGSFGVEDADVELTFDGGRALSVTTTSGGSWSVTVDSGLAHTYIGGLSEGSLLTLQAVATRSNYAAATVDLTATVDLEDPAITYDDIGPLTVFAPVDESPTSQSGDIATFAIDAGLLPGLSFGPATGRILGRPTEGAAVTDVITIDPITGNLIFTPRVEATTATVTATDAAGNTDELEIVFPPVERLPQVLSGFSYTPATVTFPDGAATSGPAGARTIAETPLSYMRDARSAAAGVCTVDSGTGTVTPLQAGLCYVIVTAARSGVYTRATATATVTILPVASLVGSDELTVTSLGNSDGYINRLEYEAGLAVSGMFSIQDVDVELTFDGGRALTLTTTSGGNWSVAVASGSGAAYTHIGTISAGDPLTLQAVASLTGYTPATVAATLTVDLEDPAATYSDIPPLSVGTSVDERPTSQSADIVTRTISGDLPPGLNFDAGDGRIHGTPRAAAPGRTVTVTLTDRAGNTDEVEIEFPPAKDSQTLSGFAYTPATVTFPAVATATGPTGAQTTPLAYTTSDTGVCSVASGDGEVTPLDAGTCRVTVTAPESPLYAEATATATVTIEALGGLDTNATLTVAGNTDGYINRAEYESTLTVEGEFGVEGVDVELTFDGGRPLTTQTAPDGTTWSVEVTTGTDAHTYIGQISEEAGAPLMLRAIASKAGYSDAVVELTLTVDLMDPEVMYSIPALAVGASVNIGPTRESADVSARSAVTGLPTSLSFDPDTGRISGTPDGLAVAGAVTVTLTDNAGNVGESEIVFGAVGKGMQTLSGFAYTPSRVTVSTDTTVVQEVAVTLTAPTGAQTGPLEYATDDGTVCTVTDSGTGAVSLTTPLVVGTFCRVTVTAPDGTNYFEAAATATIRIVAPGLTPEEQEVVTEVILGEVGGIAAIQAVDVIGARLGVSGAGSADPGFSLQIGAARLESTRRERERAEQMAGWTDLAMQEDFDRELLGRSSFSLGSGGEGAAWTLWGKGAYREYERDEDGVETDGEVLSGFVGLDFDRGRLRQGLAVGRTEGDGSFSAGDEESKKGTYELDLTSGYYYLRGRTDFGSLWGLLGAGSGELRIVNGDQRTTPDLTMQMAAAGAEVELRKGADFDLTARAEGMVTRLEADEALVAGADRLQVGGEYGSQRLRAALEASREMELEGGARVRPSAEAGVRYDGGDGVKGAGLELGGGMEFSSGRLTTDLHATWLAAHKEDLEEWGASVSTRYNLGRVVQHGLWLGAEAASGLERGALGLEQTGDPGAWLHDSEETDGDGDAGGLFSAEAGYGIGMRRLGLVTPFVGFSSNSSSRRTFSQGLRLRLGGGWLDAELASSQSRGGGDDDDYSYGIELKARF